MAAFSWNVLSNNNESDDYATERFEIIKKVEDFGKSGYPGEAYLDSDTPPNPTIGYGFNLNESSILDAVIIKLFYPDNDRTTLLAADVSYAADIATAVDNNTSTDSGLRAALDSVMSARHNDSGVVYATKREEFKFETPDEAKAVFYLVAEDIYEPNIDSWLSGIPYSNERAVLLSLSYNSVTGATNLLGANLKAAIENENRAEAWYQIRYQSNGNDLPGLAKRRYFESEKFGLYNPGSIDEAEARQVFQMMTHHIDDIESYDEEYGAQVAFAATAYGATVQATDAALATARDFLVDLYAPGSGIEKIWVDFAPLYAAETDSLDFSLRTEDSLILAGAGNDEIQAGSGNDLILGEADQDIVYAGNGHDVMRGHGDAFGLDGDTYYGGTDGQSYILGGFDSVDYSALAQSYGIYADMRDPENGQIRKVVHSGSWNFSGPTDTLVSIELVKGTSQDDYFLAKAEQNIVFVGGGGGDVYDFSSSGGGGSRGPLALEKPEDDGDDRLILPEGYTPENTIGKELPNGDIEIRPDPEVSSPASGGPTITIPGGGHSGAPSPFEELQPGEGGPVYSPNDFVDDEEDEAPTDADEDVGDAMDSLQPYRGDPLVLDLNGNGVSLTSLEESLAFFNLQDREFATRNGWVTGGDGLLAHDSNDNDRIDGIDELFGSPTETGFEELVTWDTNTDGKITSADDDWSDLRVWIDADEDGWTDEGELHTLGDLDITEISLTVTPSGTTINGNELVETSTFVIDSNTRTVGEVLFTIDPTHSVYAGEPVELSAQALLLPYLRGFGIMDNTPGALSSNETLLAMAQDLADIATLDDFDEFTEDFRDFMFEWAGVTGVDPDSRDADLFGGDARELEFLEHFTGINFETPWDGEDPASGIQWERVGQAFERQLLNLSLHFLTQSDETLQSVARYSPAENALVLTTADTEELDDATDGLTSSEEALYWAVLAQAKLGDTSQDLALRDFILERLRSVESDLTSGQIDFFNIGIGDWVGPITAWYEGVFGATDIYRPAILLGSDAGEDHKNPYGTATDYTDMVFRGGADDDIAVGDPEGKNVFIGNEGNDSFGGASTGSTNVYFFAAGDGQDTIAPASNGFDSVVFAAGIIPEMVSFARTGNDLIVIIGGDGDQITVEGFFLTPDSGVTYPQVVEEFRFADSTIVTWEDAMTAAASLTMGTSSGETINGTSGNDVIYGLAGADYLNGNAGSDTVHGGNDNDTITGGTGDDFLYGNAGNDVLQAGDDNDYLQGGTGNDALQGQAGNDIYGFSNGDGNDTINESSGTDKIVFGASVDKNTVNYDRSSYDLRIYYGSGSDYITVVNFFSEGYQNMYEIELVQFADGSTHDLTHIYTDALTKYGTSSGQTIYGLASAYREYPDTIFGGGGADILWGYNGNDFLAGEAGNDSVYGGPGDDTYFFNMGDGVDTIMEDTNNPGTDTLLLGSGVSVGDVSYSRSSSHLVITVGTGGDRVEVNNFFATAGYKIEYVVFADGTIHNQAHFIAEAAIRHGTSGNNVLNGFSDMDDVLYGEGGDDVLDGQGGNDTLIGGIGADSLSGGAGDDTYVWNVGDGNDTISEYYSGTDKIVMGEGVTAGDVRLIRSGSYHLRVYVGSEYITINSGLYQDSVPSDLNYRVEKIVFADQSEIDLTGGLTLTGTSSNETVAGTSNNDTLYGLAGNDTLTGGNGNDILDGGDGADSMSGGAGDDTYYVDNVSDTVTESSSSGTDVVYSSVTHTLSSNVENLFLTGSSNLNGTGNSLNNTIEGNSGDNTLSGLGGADVLKGGAGNDDLYGGDGDDFLWGEDGQDDMWGGAGADIFVFEQANAYNNVDVIKDFNTGQNDAIDINSLLSAYDPLTDALTDFVEITTVGSDSVLKIDRDGTGGTYSFVQVATIEGVTGLTDEVALATAGRLLVA